jgi:hypothetical protein
MAGGLAATGPGGLPDVTFNSSGGLNTLREGMGTIGIIGHVIPKIVDVYLYYGTDQIGSTWFGTKGGYGNPSFVNTGCVNPNGQTLGLTCTGNNYQLSELTTGLYWRILQGSFGTLQAGIQYGYIIREAYNGKGGRPTAYENVVYANLRYIPFN